MSDPEPKFEIESVISSIRRLAEDDGSFEETELETSPTGHLDRFVLTPALRVPDPEEPCSAAPLVLGSFPRPGPMNEAAGQTTSDSPASSLAVSDEMDIGGPSNIPKLDPPWENEEAFLKQAALLAAEASRLSEIEAPEESISSSDEQVLPQWDLPEPSATSDDVEPLTFDLSFGQQTDQKNDNEQDKSDMNDLTRAPDKPELTVGDSGQGVTYGQSTAAEMDEISEVMQESVELPGSDWSQPPELEDVEGEDHLQLPESEEHRCADPVAELEGGGVASAPSVSEAGGEGLVEREERHLISLALAAADVDEVLPTGAAVSDPVPGGSGSAETSNDDAISAQSPQGCQSGTDCEGEAATDRDETATTVSKPIEQGTDPADAALQSMVAEILRQELQGALGQRITQNVRKLVRREIQRVLAQQELGF